ncbi:uncharacterized protein LOC111352299 isoform X2 [Spodoptera litura]|uniref:Uncharacterized protein LOC111352299 isoform X2 n=1 Tax=Spodoptera litura TaxID=69820 RepID=A0A9J7E048_SPOLT|nr:uncharacterized protein LOC111352299 isoform X2 [Spodoptera litura]
MFRYHYLLLLIIGFDLVYVESESNENQNITFTHLVDVGSTDFNGESYKEHELNNKDKSEANEDFISEEGNGKEWSDYNHEGKDQQDKTSEGKDQKNNTPEENDQLNNTPDNVFIRPLQSGDTFTPKDLLPLTVLLLSKVENPGEGKGIVTSSKSPEELADKIFAGYFLTKKMVVFLIEEDLSGLDALQALALDKTALTQPRQGNSLHTVNMEGMKLDVEDKPRRCELTLLFKRESAPTTSSKPGLRRRHKKRPITPPPGTILKLEKNMQPNRHLILNHRGRKTNKGTKHIQRDIDPDYDNEDKKSKLNRERGETKKKAKERTPKNNKNNKRNRKPSTVTEKFEKNRLRSDVAASVSAGISITSSKTKSGIVKNGLTTTMKPVCTWRYICENPLNLDTCKLHTSCLDDSNNTPKIDNTFVDYGEKKKLDEENKLNMRFRKMFGLSILDEEVEKIIQHHILITHPENSMNAPIQDRIESLDEYFTRIIMYQNTQLSTPRPLSIDNNDENDSSSGIQHNAAEDETNGGGLYRWKKDGELRSANHKPANKTSVIKEEEEEKKSILRAPVTTTAKRNNRLK